MSFPLYDSIIRDNKIPKKDLTSKQKENMINIINNLDKNASEILIIIIYIYYNNTKKNTEKIDSITEKNNNIIPYKGNYESENISWYLNSFPNQLKHIIKIFLDMHISSINKI